MDGAEPRFLQARERIFDVAMRASPSVGSELRGVRALPRPVGANRIVALPWPVVHGGVGGIRGVMLREVEMLRLGGVEGTRVEGTRGVAFRALGRAGALGGALSVRR